MSERWADPESLVKELERLRALSLQLEAEEADLLSKDRERREWAERQAGAMDGAGDNALAAERATVSAAFHQSMGGWEEQAARRREWIRRAQQAVLKEGLERLDAAEGKRKFEIQRDLLRVTRERDAGMAAAAATLKGWNVVVEQARADLSGWEREAVDVFGVYGRGATALMTTGTEVAGEDGEATEAALAERLKGALEATGGALVGYRKWWLPRLSRAWAVSLALVLSPALLIPVADHFSWAWPGRTELIGAAVGIGVVALMLHFIGRMQSRPVIRRVSQGLARVRGLTGSLAERAEVSHRTETQRCEAAHREVADRCNLAWDETLDWLAEQRRTVPEAIEARAQRLAALWEARVMAGRNRREQAHRAVLEDLQGRQERRRTERRTETARRLGELEEERAQALARLRERWSMEAVPVLDRWRDGLRSGEEGGKNWDVIPSGPWTPPAMFPEQLRYGSLEVVWGELLSRWGADKVVGGGNQERVALPMYLGFPRHGSLVLEAGPASRSQALGTLNHVVARLLASSPPGRVAFTVYDPVGLGQNFAGLTHLSDEAGQVIDGRIWTQSGPLEERLAELNDHLEKVIQVYLRNDYPTLAEYNRQAGSIAEKYRFLVVADFPAGFTDVALRRLMSLATNGPRCGVYLLLHWNGTPSLPSDFPAAALRQAGLWLHWDQDRAKGSGTVPVLVQSRVVPGVTVQLGAAPDPLAMTAFVQQAARLHKDAHRVEVPFDQVMPGPEEIWSLDTASELRVPIGRTGATQWQYLTLGKGTRQHALVAGKTGSGKSTLFHVLITNLALWCGPDQVEFYLVDFKKGVEFKAYGVHRLPHARVVAIESDRDFGLSVLQRLDEELRRRGELFRQARVQDLPAYRRLPGAKAMPRILFLVDEFQEYFVEEDRIAQTASVLLDRIVRQGRAFGVHVILGSQTLGGAYTVARTTLGQMVVRVALQCNEADAALIMDEENSAPRLLSRPGEAIYNDAAGAKDGNSPFQVVWLTDEERDRHLRLVRERADQSGTWERISPVVFEGDAPAEVRDNGPLEALWTDGVGTAASLVEQGKPERRPRLWLGSPNAIKGPTEIRLERRAMDNLLVVGQRDEAMATMLGLAWVALMRQRPVGTARFTVVDGSPPGSPEREVLARFARLIPGAQVISRAADVGPALERVADELRRAAAGSIEDRGEAHYLLIQGLQHLRVLRPEDEFALSDPGAPVAPGTLLREILAEGPMHGVHTLATGDTWNTINRQLGRKLLGEFGYRVLFQMSANDSASFMDHPGASRLGLHRAVLYSEREGSLEIFRPYSLPDEAWMERAGDQLGGIRASTLLERR